ncbi:MAG TPA: hypothetical protein VNW72_04280 [Chthoniobacterales bacterium]|nr:hypothetical protein [Chthoniobacterales bacterium]
MPSDIEGAKKWREENTRRRAPTDRKSLARQIAQERDETSPEASILIPLIEAEKIALRGHDIIFDQLLRLPTDVAAQCNPANPMLAKAILEGECTAILCRSYEAYRLWLRH